MKESAEPAVVSASCRNDNLSARYRNHGTPPCPICDSASPQLHATNGHHYHACPNCTHQFLNFEPDDSHTEDHFDDDYFSGGGDGYPDYLANRDLLISRGRSYAKHVARHTGKESGDLLDIGSAAGFIAKGFQTRNWNVQGLEPNLSMAYHATRHEGVPTTDGTLDDLSVGKRFDLISMIQVIGHLDDPAETLAKVRQLLKPGGHVLIETWDCQSLTARALGARWHEYNPSSVLHAYSRQSLATLAERQGLRTVSSKLTTKKLKAAHAKALVKHKYQGGRLHKFFLEPALTLLPDELPIIYPADDLFWTILTPA